MKLPTEAVVLPAALSITRVSPGAKVQLALAAGEHQRA